MVNSLGIFTHPCFPIPPFSVLLSSPFITVFLYSSLPYPTLNYPTLNYPTLIYPLYPLHLLHLPVNQVITRVEDTYLPYSHSLSHLTPLLLLFKAFLFKLFLFKLFCLSSLPDSEPESNFEVDFRDVWT